LNSFLATAVVALVLYPNCINLT